MFDKERDQSQLADVYKNYVKHGLSSCVDGLPAALIIEPGMELEICGHIYRFPVIIHPKSCYYMTVLLFTYLKTFLQFENSVTSFLQ